MTNSSSIHIRLTKEWSIPVPRNLSVQILVLFPFLLIYGGTVFQNTIPIITTISKTAAFVYMILYVILKGKVKANLFYSTLLFIPILIYGIFNAWNFKAGFSDGIRYLFPIAVLFYSYAIRAHFKLLLKFVIFFITLNFLVQIVNYVNWLRGIQQWFYYTTEDGYVHYNMTSGVIRATGTVVFFGFLGFLSMISFFLIKFYYRGKYKWVLLSMSLFLLFASFSYKAFGPFLIILLAYYYKDIYKFVLGLAAGILGAYLIIPEHVNVFFQNLILRIKLYITQGNSARSESYRVMWDEILSGNWFGRGAGVFGGPASTAYDSWYYKMVAFNWFDAKWLGLTTTDTYLPHLFVELGIIGGLVYLMILIMPLIRQKITKGFLVALAIYLCLFFDMLFSFSLNNLDYLMYSLAFIYPVLYYIEGNNSPKTTSAVHEK